MKDPKQARSKVGEVKHYVNDLTVNNKNNNFNVVRMWHEKNVSP